MNRLIHPFLAMALASLLVGCGDGGANNLGLSRVKSTRGGLSWVSPVTDSPVKGVTTDVTVSWTFVGLTQQ